MQDYTFLDDCDYTLCNECHSSIQPYNNPSLPTISTSITSTITTTTTITIHDIQQNLKSIDSITRALLEFHHLHCAKCGLYIEIHPNYEDIHSQKLFLCSNHFDNVHKYCLCYHCGLLYGINPNQKSLDIISTLLSQIGLSYQYYVSAFYLLSICHILSCE